MAMATEIAIVMVMVTSKTRKSRSQTHHHRLGDRRWGVGRPLELAHLQQRCRDDASVVVVVQQTPLVLGVSRQWMK